MVKDKKGPKTEAIHKKRLSGVGRRNFTKYLLSAGFGAGAIAGLTVEDVKAAASDEVPIVIGYETDEFGENLSPVTKRVPADWYNNNQHAKAVHERRAPGLLKNPHIKGVGYEPGEYGGKNAQITVTVDAKHKEAAASVPDSVEGVPFEVSYGGYANLGACNCHSGDYNTWHTDDTVPGGMQICNGNGSYGTLTGRAVQNGDEYFLINNHMFGGNNTDHQGEPVYQPDCSSEPLGDVKRGYCRWDAMLINPKNDHDPVSYYEDANPTDRITGFFNRSGLSDIKASGRDIEKYGCTTGRTSGKIKNTDKWTSTYGCKNKTGQLVWGTNNDMDDGDSGSLAYHEEPDGSGGYSNNGIWACGLCSARTADWAEISDDYVWGTSAWKLNNAEGIIIG